MLSALAIVSPRLDRQYGLLGDSDSNFIIAQLPLAMVLSKCVDDKIFIWVERMR